MGGLDPRANRGAYEEGPRAEGRRMEEGSTERRKEKLVLLDLLDATRQQVAGSRSPLSCRHRGSPFAGQGPVRRGSVLAARCRRPGSEQGTPLAACSQPGAPFPCGDLQRNLTEGSRAHHDSVLNSHIRRRAYQPHRQLLQRQSSRARSQTATAAAAAAAKAHGGG